MEIESGSLSEPEESKEQNLEEFPEDLGKQIKSYHVGSNFFAAGMLVKDRKTGVFGIIASMRKDYDPVYHMQKKSMPLINVALQDGSQKEMRAWDTIPVYALMGGPNEPEVKQEVPEVYQNDLYVKTGDRQFKLGQTIKVAGQTRTIVIIIPEENLQIVATAQNRKGHKRLFQVSSEVIEPIETKK